MIICIFPSFGIDNFIVYPGQYVPHMLSRSEKSKVMGVNNMKILIAEDNRDIALVYRVALQNRNHHLVITDNGEDCLTIYREKLKHFISRMGSLDKDKQHVFDVRGES